MCLTRSALTPLSQPALVIGRDLHGFPAVVVVNLRKRIAPGVLDELRSKTPRTRRGHRKNRFHQWLTDDVGHPRLQEHISALIALMKSSDDWEDFEKRLNKALPKFKPMPLLDGVGDYERPAS